MAEIKCPMCGKPNPDHLDVCEFCEARIKPLVIQQPDENVPDHQDQSGSDDWMNSMRDGMAENFDPEDELMPDGEDDSQDWLNRIQPESAPEENPPPEPESFQEMDQSTDGGDDWLERIRTLQKEDQKSENEELDDFINSSESQESGDAFDLNPAEIPDWLGADPSDDEFDLVDDSDPAVPAEVPDWLAGVGESEIPSIDTPEAAKPKSETPDWLADLGMNREPDKMEPEEEIPDWLSNVGVDIPSDDPPTSDPGADIDTPAFDDPENEDDLPGWLSDISGDMDVPETVVDEVVLEGDDPPDWLSEMADGDGLGESDPESIESMPDAGSDEERPGWLRNLSSVVTGSVEDYPEESEPEDGTTSPFIIENDFDAELLDLEGLPDWISSEAKDEAPEEENLDPNLAPADLPGWLEAMRPADSDAAGIGQDDSGQIESAGPLAGLRSVLAAEPEVAKLTKPPVYSMKLQVGENHQNHVALFNELLDSEGEVRPIMQTPLVSSQRILRWIIAAVLILLVATSIISNQQSVPLPTSMHMPNEVRDLSSLIHSIPNGAPVLLAFDYEPGTSGEMNAAASAVVDHLMLKGSRISIISTLPTGPGMAEYFIRTVQSKHEYTSGRQYINLGYIAGGAPGLLGFAQNPKFLISTSFDGLEPWSTPPLRGVEQVSDYALILVITDDASTARIWVEQIYPQLDDTPLAAVVSAQIDPMVRPYYGTNQPLKGFVSGIMGGASYEFGVVKNLSSSYWDAFNIGIVIAAASILLGGGVNGVLILFNASKDNRGKS